MDAKGKHNRLVRLEKKEKKKDKQTNVEAKVKKFATQQKPAGLTHRRCQHQNNKTSF